MSARADESANYPEIVQQAGKWIAKNGAEYAMGLVLFHYKLAKEHIARCEARLERQRQSYEQGKRETLCRALAGRFDVDAFDPHGYFVYLLWGDDPETPLYVGQSTNILSRLGSHMTNPDGRRDATRRVQIMRCRGRGDMDATERRLIETHQPPLNKAGIHPRRDPAARRSLHNVGGAR